MARMISEDGNRSFSDDRLIEAQHAVLGSMLIDPECVGVVMADANEKDFTDELAPVFVAFRELYFAKEKVDAVTVLAKIRDNLGMGAIHYQKFLTDLMVVTPTAANLKAYLKILKEQSAVRRAGSLGYELVNAHNLEEASAIVDELNKLFCERSNVKVVSFMQGLKGFYDRHDGAKPPDYLRWGFGALNNALCAQAGSFVIVGGYPSAGKTVLAIQFGWEMASYSGKRVGMFSLETDDETLYDELICGVAGIPFDEVNHNSLSNDSWSAVSGITHYSDTVHMDVIRAGNMTVNDIRAISLSRHYDVIFIDYLQLINPGTHYRGNRTEEVSGISRALHTFAQTSNVTVVALSQLTRQDKGEKYKAPTMSSLRESGQLEQDADIVMLLYLVDEAAMDGPRRLKIAKNKKGKRGTYIDLDLDVQHMKFVQKSSRTDEPPQQKLRFTELPPGNKQEIMAVFNGRGGTE